MIRVNGPYRHGDRWRIAFRIIGERKLHYRSFATREEAERVAAETTQEIDEVALSALSEPLALPDDPAWVYTLHDEAGVVVYVGCTRDLNGRYFDHRELHVPFATMSFYPEALDRRTALALESALIRKLSPRLNTAGIVETDRETDRYVPRTWKSPQAKT